MNTEIFGEPTFIKSGHSRIIIRDHYPHNLIFLKIESWPPVDDDDDDEYESAAVFLNKEEALALKNRLEVYLNNL